MKRLLCAVSVLALFVPCIASAQQPSDRHQGNKQQGQHQNRPGKPNDRPTIQPVKPIPNRPNRPNRPGHRPPVTVQPVRPGHPNRPGHRPPHFKPIHRPAYRYPRGYHYRRWSVGLIIPHVFLSNYYYFDDWSLLGLYPPPRHYRWVRYGPDLLLVNIYTGRIRDVIYGAFY